MQTVRATNLVGNGSGLTNLNASNITSGIFTGNGGGLTNLNASRVFNVIHYGGSGNGVADNTDAITNALAAAVLAGGGTIYFPAGLYRIASPITIPTSGVHQASIRIIGDGQDFNQRRSPTTGSVLLMDATNGLAKLTSLGCGSLEIAQLSMLDTNATSVPFLFVTYTALHCHDVTFYGKNNALLGDTPTQDAILLGGTNGLDISSVASNAPFQGYITVIEACNFDRIRRAVYLRAYGNSVVIQNNSVWQHCGGDAAMESDGFGALTEAYYNHGIVFQNNLIELIGGYAYGIKLTNSSECSLVNNAMWDATTNYVAGVWFCANSPKNFLIAGTDGGSGFGLS